MNNNERSEFYKELSDALKLRIEHLETLSGQSGAYAHLVQSEGSRWAFCKIFEDEDAYNQEVKSNEVAVLRLNSTPNILHTSHIELGEQKKRYFYILMNWIGATKNQHSFHEFYLKKEPNAIKRLLSELFKKRFIGDLLDDTLCAFHHITFDQSFHDNLTNNEFNVDDYQDFISWWDAKKECINFPITINTVHGDLHSNNIRVDDIGNPHLIDFGCTGKKEALKDFARLERDLRLSVLYEIVVRREDNERTFTNTQFDIENALEQISAGGKPNNIASELDKAIIVISHIRQLSRERYVGKQWDLEYNYLLMLEFMFYAASSLDRPTITRKSAFRLGIHQMEKVESILTQEYLWKIAYSLLRLDQLPIGGWGKSIPGWWKALRSDTQDSLYYAYQLRSRGGMNVTCNAFIQYFYFISRVIGFDMDSEYDQKDLNKKFQLFHKYEAQNKIAQKVIDKYIKPRVGHGGGMDIFPRSIEDGRPRTNIHHSILAMICYVLAYMFYHDTPLITFTINLRKLFNSTTEFLENNLQNWEQDETKQYAIFAGISYLLYLLNKKPLIGALFETCDIENFKNILKKAQRDILKSGQLNFQIDGDFLLQSHYFFNQTGTGFNLDLNESINNSFDKENFRAQFFGYIVEMAESCDQSKYGLIQKEHDRFDFTVCEDIGSLAQLCALLNKSLTQSFFSSLGQDLSEITKNLKKKLAIISTEYSENQKRNFKLTNGITYSYILNTIDMHIPKDDLDKLEKMLGRIEFITEYEICNLLSNIFIDSSYSFSDGKDNIYLTQDTQARLNIINTYFMNPTDFVPKKIMDLKNFYLSKIQPGTFNPKMPEEKIKMWLKTTEDFFLSELAEKNATANEKREKRFNGIHLSGHLKYLKADSGNKHQLRVLDIGCGKAYYAVKHFFPNGFSVDFLDYSQKILDLAEQKIQKMKSISEKWTAYHFDINNFNANMEQYDIFKGKKYDLIFCDAVLFHISKGKLPDVLSALRNLLKNTGILFGNFKVNDHTIVSIDGRFFEFYENHREIGQLFLNAGFKIREITLTRKEETMYDERNTTYWAHYYCTKELYNNEI